MESIMQSNQKVDRIAGPLNGKHMFNDRCSCLGLSDVGRSALLAIVLGGVVAVTSGCSSTEGSVRAGLIAPVIKTQAGTVSEDDSVYQPPRSPGFNDLIGS
jgi:hypothetical protein